MLNKKRTILWLVQLSMVTVLIDGIVGLDVFINTTSRLGFLLSIIWVTKVVLVAPLSLRVMTRLFVYPIFLMIGFTAFINFFRGLFDLQSVDAFLSGVFFYLLIFFGGGAGYAWSSLTNKGENIRLSDKTVNLSVILLFIFCSIYFM